MNTEKTYADLENELKWRWDEIRGISNKLGANSASDSADVFRKTLVIMLYAHFEGFAKNAFEAYVQAINAEALTCDQVNEQIVAGALTKMFSAYDNLDKKSAVFKSKLPDDSKLHRLARRIDLLQELSKLKSHQVKLPAQDLCDTESNLWPWVLKKILYRLGLDYQALAHLDGTLSKLVNKRNNIAHGAEKGGVTLKEYETFRSDVDAAMREIMRMVISALRREAYLKKDSPHAA